MAPLVNSDDLIGGAEVAEILGLAHVASVSTYMRRYDDFPMPVVDLKRSRVRLWARSEVEQWQQTRNRARGRPARE